MKKRLEIIFYGRVQRIGFRHFSQIIANQLAITGWVKNNPDGSVTIVAEGEKEKLTAFVKALETRHILAHIENAETNETDFKNEFKDFKIIY